MCMLATLEKLEEQLEEIIATVDKAKLRTALTATVKRDAKASLKKIRNRMMEPEFTEIGYVNK